MTDLWVVAAGPSARAAILPPRGIGPAAISSRKEKPVREKRSAPACFDHQHSESQRRYRAVPSRCIAAISQYQSIRSISHAPSPLFEVQPHVKKTVYPNNRSGSCEWIRRLAHSTAGDTAWWPWNMSRKSDRTETRQSVRCELSTPLCA